MRCATCSMRHAAYDMRHVTCSMRHATCDVQHATCKMRHAACDIPYATSNVRHAKSDMQCTKGNMPHATCFPLVVRQPSRRTARLQSPSLCRPPQSIVPHTSSKSAGRSACCRLHVAYCMSHFECCMSHVTCRMLHSASEHHHTEWASADMSLPLLSQTSFQSQLLR